MAIQPFRSGGLISAAIVALTNIGAARLFYILAGCNLFFFAIAAAELLRLFRVATAEADGAAAAAAAAALVKEGGGQHAGPGAELAAAGAGHNNGVETQTRA